MFECFSAESVRESGYFVKFMRSCDGFGAILNRAWERNSSRSRKKRNNLSPRWAGPRQGYCSVKNMMTMRMVTMMRILMTMTMMSGGFVVKSGRRVSSPGKPATLFDPALLLIIIDHRRNDDDQSHWLNSTKQDHQRWKYIVETLSLYANMEWFEQMKRTTYHNWFDQSYGEDCQAYMIPVTSAVRFLVPRFWCSDRSHCFPICVIVGLAQKQPKWLNLQVGKTPVGGEEGGVCCFSAAISLHKTDEVWQLLFLVLENGNKNLENGKTKSRKW